MQCRFGSGLWIAATVGASLSAAAASAQTAPAQPTNDVNIAGDRITIGVGAAVLPRYVGADSSTVIPAVAFQGQVAGRSFNTQGASLTVDLIPDDGKPGWKLQAGPTLNIRADRTSHVGQAQVAALGKLSTAWEPGAWVGIQRTGVVTSPYDTLSVNIAWQRDIAGAYDGAIVSPGVSYGTPLSHRDYVSISANADYVGRRFGTYYYVIDDAASARSGLRPYANAGRAGWKDWNLSFLAAHALRGDLTHGIGVFATAGYTRLLGVYARSPIVADVGNRDQWSGAAGLTVTL